MLAFFTENNENEHLIFREFHARNVLLKESTQTMKNKMKLHILGPGVPVHKLDNYS